MRRVLLDPLPFRIGRGRGAHLIIAAQEVSKKHTEILRDDGTYLVRDLNSTNGTFLNGARVAEAELQHDDLVQIAHEEFRFFIAPAMDSSMLEAPLTAVLQGDMPNSVLRRSQYLHEMVAEQWGRVLFQPIVELASGEVLGYEGLGRGMHTSLRVPTGDLFDLADKCGLAVPLSQMFLRMAVQDVASLPSDRLIFLNLHPSEILNPTLPATLGTTLGKAKDDRQFVVEINEKAIVDLESLRQLREKFREMGLLVAYDDFGAGQARFLELADIPPDFVKLDMALIRDLHQNASRQNLVKAITRASLDLGIQVVAEGIQTSEEADVCRELGCKFGQGFLLGRPQTASLLQPKSDTTAKIVVTPETLADIRIPAARCTRRRA
ncbi:MAG: EAL domain-containing protein [Planctomycetes bacterium]|nr:EAL domain-containing protein [Planctomycetota bacterium]